MGAIKQKQLEENEDESGDGSCVSCGSGTAGLYDLCSECREELDGH